ncbi:MAG: YbjQ family protein [Oligoflexia bacterium]|nr:YbjQ family protein [Oligoflexia bacterium]
MSTTSLERLLRLAVLTAGLGACTTLPTPRVTTYTFPKGEAFVGNASRPYETLGLVRTKVEYFTLDPAREEADLCRNYYNKAVRDLVKRAKEKGADAVIDIKTVVFTLDGRQEFHSTPECTDEGDEGQVLAQAIAIRWKRNPEEYPANEPDAESRPEPSVSPAPASVPLSASEEDAELDQAAKRPRIPLNSPFRQPGR